MTNTSLRSWKPAENVVEKSIKSKEGSKIKLLLLTPPLQPRVLEIFL